jgi:Lytic transglycolase
MRKGAVLIAAFLLAQAPVGAQTPDDLEEARRDHRAARAQADLAAAGLAQLTGRYARVRVRADRAAARLIDAYLQQTTLQGELARSQSLLDNRADAIYRAGPAAFMEVLLGSSRPADFLARQEMIERALGRGVDQANTALEAHDQVTPLRRQIERHRLVLSEQQHRLEELRVVMEIRLAEAQAAAQAVGRRVRSLEAQQRALLKAAREEQRFSELIQVDGELGELLERLGPTGGRGCTIPEALERTGQTFSGEASFYGDEFAGNPTAIGHPFNPDLFTAAHRTLPLPSYLHVTYGQRCATVLVNDRGPYVDGRILDLSEGSAKYLGLPGVGDIHAEILVPS